MSDQYDQLAYKLRKALSVWLLPFTSENVGTYSPTYQGGTSGGSTTYTTRQGAWTRIGPMVFVTGLVQWSAATGTGDARISLPFTSANVASQNHAGSLWMSSVTFANNTPLMLLGPNAAYISLYSPLTNAANTTVAVEAAGLIVFSVSYRIE